MRAAMHEAGRDERKMSAGEVNRLSIFQFVRSAALQNANQLVAIVRMPGEPGRVVAAQRSNLDDERKREFAALNAITARVGQFHECGL